MTMNGAALRALGGAALIVAISLGAPISLAQQPVTEPFATAIERTADGRPRLDGLWQALVSANWDIRPHAARPGPLAALGASGAVPPGVGIVVGDEIPYQPWAHEQQRQNEARQLELDTEVKCFMPGVPRATYLPQPLQILQTDEHVIIAYQYANAVRTIYMSDPGPAPTSFWMGWSVGRWEGETLVVDVTNQKAETWFDRAGNFHSEAFKVVERYTPMGPNHLMYEATLEDPKVFTRPWTIRFPLYRRVEDHTEMLEFKCVPFAEELMYGHLRRRPPRATTLSEAAP
jgi:hypothetical protein